jgi:TPR repeat protein
MELAQNFHYFKTQALKEDPESIFNAGLCYYNGWGCTENRPMAVKFFLRAAVLENVDAQYWLGRCYHLGKGVRLDLKKGFQWLERATRNDHPEAHDLLGFCYRFDTGVPIPREGPMPVVTRLQKAREHYTKAAELGITMAWNSLEQMDIEATASARYLGKP